MYMHDDTQNKPTFDDIPVLLANIEERLGVIVGWFQSGASQQNPHAILTIDEAVAFTGYSKSAIHSATSKATIPHFKRGNKLFFYKDELEEWLKSDERPKRGKRFRDKNNSKEPVVANDKQKSALIADEFANNTNSVAEATDTSSNQVEMATSVQEEAVSTCQSSEIPPSSEVVSDAELEHKDSDDESEDTSTEPVPTSGIDVDSCMDGQKETGSSNVPLTDEHISNGSVEQQGKETTIPSFPFFSLDRHEATDDTPAKSVIRFFNKIPHEHYYAICKAAEDRHGKRVINNTVSFEFATYDDALQTAQSITEILSPRTSDCN